MSATLMLRRLERGERVWPAEIGLRSVGMLVLALCASLGAWLYRSIHVAHLTVPGVIHYLGALLAVVCWSVGWALVAEGPGLFKLMPRPPRTIYRQF